MHGDRQNDVMSQEQILQECHQYDDIIYLSRPVSQKHLPMERNNRAAQFSPFAALTGHDAAIQETARLTNRWMELDEQSLVILNEKIQILQNYLKEAKHPLEITVTYFLEDRRKQGGNYLTEIGILKKINEYEQQLILQNGVSIAVDRIVELECDLFAVYSL